MKKSMIVWCLALSAALLFTACQAKPQEKESTEKVTETEKITEQETERPTVDPVIKKFVGCWEYYDSYDWICIRKDGTYELIDEHKQIYGPYTAEVNGKKLVLADFDITLEMDESGNLVTGDEEVLFKTTLPDLTQEETTEETWEVDPVLQHNFEVAGECMGSWRYDEIGGWIVINSYVDGFYYTYDETGRESGNYTYDIDGDEIYLSGHGVSVHMGEDGNLISSDGAILVRSDVPKVENYNDLMTGEWNYSDGEYILIFDGMETFTLTGPDAVVTGRYLYDETGIHFYNFDEEIYYGDINNAGNLILDDMDGYFYPAQY